MSQRKLLILTYGLSQVKLSFFLLLLVIPISNLAQSESSLNRLNQNVGVQSEIIYNLDFYSTPPDDREEISSRIRKLENYQQDQILIYDDFTKSKGYYLKIPKRINEGELTRSIKKIKDLIIEFNKSESSKNEINYIEIINEYDNIYGFFNSNIPFPRRIYSAGGSNEKLTALVNDTRDKILSIISEYFDGENSLNMEYDAEGGAIDSRISNAEMKANVNSIDKYIAKAERADIEKFNKEIENEYKAFEAKIVTEVNSIENQITKTEEFLKRHKEKRKELNKDINEWGITKGLPWFCATVIILFLVTVFSKRINYIGFGARQNAEINEQEHLSKVLLEVITVLLLTLTILILGLSNILKENVLGTLIGGIAAYILNRSQNFQSKDLNKSLKPTQENVELKNEISP